jgi:hypothetical protein
MYVQMTELETYMLEMQALIMLMLRANRQHVLSLRQKNTSPMPQFSKNWFSVANENCIKFA